MPSWRRASMCVRYVPCFRLHAGPPGEPAAPIVAAVAGSVVDPPWRAAIRVHRRFQTFFTKSQSRCHVWRSSYAFICELSTLTGQRGGLNQPRSQPAAKEPKAAMSGRASQASTLSVPRGGEFERAGTMSQERVLPVKRFEATDEAGRTFSIVGSKRVRIGGGAAGPAGSPPSASHPPRPPHDAARVESSEEEVLSMTLQTVEGFPVHPVAGSGGGVFDIDVMGEMVRVHAAETDLG